MNSLAVERVVIPLSWCVGACHPGARGQGIPSHSEVRGVLAKSSPRPSWRRCGKERCRSCRSCRRCRRCRSRRSSLCLRFGCNIFRSLGILYCEGMICCSFAAIVICLHCILFSDPSAQAGSFAISFPLALLATQRTTRSCSSTLLRAGRRSVASHSSFSPASSQRPQRTFGRCAPANVAAAASARSWPTKALCSTASSRDSCAKAVCSALCACGRAAAACDS